MKYRYPIRGGIACRFNFMHENAIGNFSRLRPHEYRGLDDLHFYTVPAGNQIVCKFLDGNSYASYVDVKTNIVKDRGNAKIGNIIHDAGWVCASFNIHTH